MKSMFTLYAAGVLSMLPLQAALAEADADAIAFASASAACKNQLTYTDRVNESTYAWQEKPGGHDFGIRYRGFNNFARIFGAK